LYCEKDYQDLLAKERESQKKLKLPERSLATVEVPPQPPPTKNDSIKEEPKTPLSEEEQKLRNHHYKRIKHQEHLLKDLYQKQPIFVVFWYYMLDIDQ
jgi:hypothetical protein